MTGARVGEEGLSQGNCLEEMPAEIHDVIDVGIEGEGKLGKDGGSKRQRQIAKDCAFELALLEKVVSKQ